MQTRAKQYNKGRRRDICGLILQCGGLTNKGLRLYWNGKEEYRNKSQTVATLKREGIIKETKLAPYNTSPVRMYTINEMSDEFSQCIPAFPLGTYPVYKEFLKPIERCIGAKSAEDKQERAMKMIDAQTLMLIAGVNCTAVDMFNLFNPMSKVKGSTYCVEGGKNYFIPYQYRRKDQEDIITASRSIGTYLHQDKEAYLVYNFGDTRPIWKRIKEEEHWLKKTSMMIEDLCPDWDVNKTITDRSRRAIVIGTDKPIADLILENPNDGPERKYLLLPNMYRPGMYHVPFSEDGVEMMRLINRPRWREYILRTVLGERYGSAKRGTGISHDANDGRKMTLVYCVPDIEKLRNFVINARAYDEKENFEIICFPYQLPLVQKVAGDVCTIHIYPMEKLEGVGEKFKA